MLCVSTGSLVVRLWVNLLEVFLIREPSDVAGQELSGKIFKDVLVYMAQFMDSMN